MNTIKGMIKDLRREETHIGGCTTKGELIIALESLERCVELPYNATNGEVLKALFPNLEIESRPNEECVYIMGAYRTISHDWWNAPYKAESEGKQ